MKRFIKVFVMILFILLMTGCKESEPVNKKDNNHINELPTEYKNIIGDKKVYITSIGQSIDIENLGVYLNRIDGFEFTLDSTLEAKDIENDSILFLVTGCSIKAMTDAGITVNDELNRLKEFANKHTFGTEIIVLHLGGMSRRGSTSDGLIEEAIKTCDLVVYVKSGNDDNFLSTQSNNNKVPYYEIDSIGNMISVVKYFRGDE